MPFIYDPNLENEKKRQESNGDTEPVSPGQPQSLGTQSATVTGGAPSSSTGGTQSGQYTNLQSYLTANQGQQFGGRVADRIGQDVDTASREQQSAGDQFRTKVGENTINYDENLAERAKSDASSVAGDATQRSQFERMRDANYAGPRGLEDTGEAYTRATGATQNAQKAAQLSSSESGQQALLQNYYGRPDYSRGQTNLDQFLVQNDESAKPKFANVQQRGQQLSGQFDTLKQQLAGQAQIAADATNATRQRVQQEFLGEQGAIARQRAAFEEQARLANERAAAGVQGISQGRAPVDSLKGLTTYGTDLSRFVTPQQANASNIATAEQAEDFGALNQLLQQQNNLDPSQAGQFNSANPYAFDKAGYDQFVGQQDQFYNSLFNAPTQGGPTQIQDPRVVSAFNQYMQENFPNYAINPNSADQSLIYNHSQGLGTDPNSIRRQRFERLQALLNESLGRNQKLE